MPEEKCYLPDGYRFVCVDDDPSLLDETYRLRYAVYCLETGFLDSDSYPDGREIDEWDAHSRHFAAINPEGGVIGTIRLVEYHPEAEFPLEDHCKKLTIDVHNLPRRHLAEISRLAVSRSMRRRVEDGLFGVESYIIKQEGGIFRGGDSDSERMKRFRPIVILGLFRAMYQESKRRNITHWYAAMERKLHYALKRYGILFYQIGEQVDYYGPVIPYYGVVKEVELKLYSDRPFLMHTMSNGLPFSLLPEVGIKFKLKHILYVLKIKFSLNNYLGASLLMVE